MQSEKDNRKTKRSNRNIKILAWILLFTGILCIICPILYVTVWLDRTDDDVGEDTKIAKTSRHAIEPFGKILDTSEGVPLTSKGCYELSCRVDCQHSNNFYLETAVVMVNSNCEVIASLMISNSYKASIENSWIAMNTTVIKIELYKNRIRKIKSGAFDSQIFAKVVHMTWIDLKVDEISRGALLGLYSLRKLEIDFKVPSIGFTLLQPVQLTLTHLRMNCGISFNSNAYIFNNLSLDKLKHLDLSHNQFNGSLSKRIFSGTPNVSYLHLKNCMIKAIDDNAFEDIAHKLIYVDLKHNFLTQINADLLGIGSSLLLIDVEPNKWICNCQLRSLFKFYKKHKKLFISAPYCRKPLSLYGKLFDEIQDGELSCDSASDSLHNMTFTTAKTINDKYDVKPRNKTIVDPILQFSCTQAINIDTTLEERSIRDLSDIETTTTNGNQNSFVFEPPPFDLSLSLFENYSVKATIDGYLLSDELNIIWFTEDVDNHPVGSYPKDYNCMQYENPYLIIDSVQENHTYTFCMMPKDDIVISPLFCQPLYVPISHNDDEADEIWIDESEKQFTIGMLCLIFFLSSVFGAIIAYLGIKSFPNLLEGSKNVLVIKESEKTCQISTIGDPQYMKTSCKNGSIPDNSYKIMNQDLSEVSIGHSGIQVASPISFASSSTYFEKSFSHIDMQSIEYEMPIQFNKKRSKLSECLDRPNSPPPLPKRNSSLSLHKDQQLETLENPQKF